MTDSSPAKSLLDSVETAIVSAVKQAQVVSPSAYERRGRIDAALAVLISLAEGEATGARKVADAAGLAGLLSKILPGEGAEKAAALEERMELVRFLATQWEFLASKAREIKSSLDQNIKADEKESAELAEEILELVRAIRASLP